MINVDFGRFSRPPPKSTDEEKQAFYEERRDEYTIDDRAALRIALLEKEPAPYDWEVTHDRAMQLYDSIQTGADFAELAKDFSEDPGSAAQGGDLGWFPKGQMVKEFDRWVFAAEEGDLSEPIRTQYGWHIIKHHGFKTAPYEPPGGRGKSEEPVKQASCSHILIKAVPSRETLDQLYRRIDEFRRAALSSGFFQAAEEHEMPVKESGMFFKNGNIQFLGRDQDANDFAFENEVGEISPVLENNSAIFVLQVADRRAAGPATYEEAAQRVDLDIVKHKVMVLCRDTAQAIHAAIQAGDKFADAATKFGEEVETPEPFGRSTYIRGFGNDPEAVGRAFALTEIGQISEPVEYDQGVVIFRLLERMPADLSKFTEQRDSLATQLLTQKQQELYGRWYQLLVEGSDIVNNVKTLQARQEFL
jgi:parvulin-like peptidyl-prolyl isomerase